jgi:hypothetical protein
VQILCPVTVITRQTPLAHWLYRQPIWLIYNLVNHSEEMLASFADS